MLTLLNKATNRDNGGTSIMITFTRALAVGVVFAGAAVGLASPASAEPLSGSFLATITDVNPAWDKAGPGDAMDVTLVPCGADCTTFAAPHVPHPWSTDLHLQGTSWTGTQPDNGYGTCPIALDNNTRALIIDCPSVPTTIHFSLT
jgi:hypothetical protein